MPPLSIYLEKCNKAQENLQVSCALLFCLIINNPSCPHRRPVIHAGDGDSGPGIAGMDHLAAAHIDGHMVDPGTVAVEHQITGL